MSLLFAAVVLVVSFLLGVAFVPGLVGVGFTIFGAPRALREVVARVLWVLGQIANGATALRVRGSEWRLERMFEQPDGSFELLDGGVVDADEVYQFGLRPFAIVSDVEDLNQSWCVEHDAPLKRRSVGGTTEPEYRPWTSEDGQLVDLTTVAQYFRGECGNELVMAGLEKGLEESGGQQQIGVVVTTIAFVVMAMLGAGLGWFIA